MKKTVTILMSMLFVAGSFAQAPVIMPQYGTNIGGGVEVDLNNDGYLDLVLGGEPRTMNTVEDPDGNEVEISKQNWLLMFDPVTKKYEEKEFGFLNANRAFFRVADLNGDGIMDLVVTEHARDDYYAPGIYEGKGDGTFEKKEMTFDDDTYQFRPVTIEVADFNNDGLADIAVIGYENVENELINYSAILMNKGNYKFEVTNTELLQTYNMALVFIKVADFNNDGYMDLIMSGNCDNCLTSGHQSFTEIFTNFGDDSPGDFYAMSIGDVIKMKAVGGIDIADFNADGWLDFAIHGEGKGTNEPSGAQDEWTCISHVYMNERNGSFTDKAQPNFSKDLRPLNTTGLATRTIDWDGDGHYDLFIQGWNPLPETGTQAGFFFKNDGSANFAAPSRMPGASEGFILFPDWNGDGKKDYFMSGFSADETYFTTEEEKGRTSAVVLNTRSVVNERPAAPAGLAVALDDNKVTLSWNAATDKETPANALSYEYYLKKDGKFYTSCRSHVGGSLDGVRKVVDHGNAMLNKSITLRLAGGTYEWGVQAIDASYEGSTFATGTAFTVEGGDGVDVQSINGLFNIYSSKNSLTLNASVAATIEVYSLTGTLLALQENVETATISLPQGLYIAKVTINNETIASQVIIQ